MNTSLSWLKAYVPDLDVTAQEYTDAMTLSGTKVEGYEQLDADLEKIVIGQIDKIEKHPDADKLVVCQVNVGTETVQIVTGAKNVFEGAKVPVVLDGGRVAGGHEPGQKVPGGIKIKKGKLRGVASFGMMCSIEELGSTTDMYPEAPEDGIYIFPEDAEIGASAIEALDRNDVVFEYEVTSNRVDCYSVLGIAREAAATFNKEFVPPIVKETGNGEDVNDYIKVTVEDAEAEIKKFDDAMSQTAKELESIKEAAAKNLSAEEAAVFDAHALVLQDPELKTQVEDKIRNEKINADAALDEVANTFIAMFESMDDDYFRERAADIKDVSRRLLANLLGKSLPNPALIDEEVVIIADDLTPSDTAQLNKNLVRGFATNIGGRTSHSAIMARSLEIPAVVSCKTITDETNDADMVVLDGEAGIVIINPSDDEIKEYQAKREAFIAYKEELKKMKNEKSVTLDDHHVELVANIGSPKDIQGVLDNGGEGVGLFRTEFLYMESAQLPTEEEIEAIDLPKEMNPFLGVRAVRLCFQREDIFRVQLRALLRASVYGDLRIMFPMIATLDEFRKAKGILMEEKEKLISEGIEVSDTLQVGIMIEIPAAAVLADQFAKEVDFFSIGTNDLVQYTFAADRMSSGVSYLYQPFHPSILRLVKHVIDSAHAEGKWTGMCGEMAGEAIAAPLLIGLGLDEFSMSATSILSQRKLIRSMKKSEMNELAAKAINCGTMEEVVALVKEAVEI